MKLRNLVFLMVVVFLAGAGIAFGEEKFGIKVYGGAKLDAATSKSVSESMSINAACYRTNDSVAKVVGFYKKQAGLELLGGNNEGAMFKKGSIDITIQNPWMDMTTGKMNKDTLISIVKQKE